MSVKVLQPSFRGVSGKSVRHSTARNFKLSALAFVLILCAAQARSGDQEDPVLGRAGDISITEREFRERFQLTPGLHRQGATQLDTAKLEFLHSMIAEKLLAQEALARGLDADSLYQRALAEVTKLLARDALYRREVYDRVAISDAELQQSIRRARKEIRVKFIYSEDSLSASRIRSRIVSEPDFDRIVLDSISAAFRDTATIVWGQADTAIEAAAYSLSPGAVSAPVAAGGGHYVMALAATPLNTRFASLDIAEQRDQVLSVLRQRKERARTEEHLRTTLKEGSAYSPPSSFVAFAREVGEVFAQHLAGPQGTRMTPEMAADLRQRCATFAADTVLVAGSMAWTVEEVTDLLVQRGFVIAGDPQRRASSRLYDVFWEWASQELLAQEGLRRGLDAAPDVQQALAPWRDYYLATLMKSRIASTIEVSDEEVYRHLSDRGAPASVPRVRVRELRTASLSAMGEALSALEEGMPFGEVVERWTADPAARATQGVTPLFAITDRAPVGMLASRLEVGERFGPAHDSTGYLFFEVLEKQEFVAPGDTTAGSRLREAREELMSVKARDKVTLFLAKAGQDRGFEVHTDRLRQVQVSSVPTLTFRLLGFGGRMLALPVVDPQLDWLTAEPPAGLEVP